MLDKRTGELYIESIPVKLGPRFTRRDLSSAPVAARSEIVNEPHHSYSLGEQSISDEPFVVVLYFFGQQLESIDLTHSAEGLWMTWESWSEERELRRKEKHDDWLRRQTGQASHVYDWGEIASVYDPRSGGSSIVIRFSWQGEPWRRRDPT